MPDTVNNFLIFNKKCNTANKFYFLIKSLIQLMNFKPHWTVSRDCIYENKYFRTHIVT